MDAQAIALYAGRIYPGLRPFETEDALLFFGREEQTDELLRRLQDTRFLAVVGMSGSGKSSLVRAGLLPALHRGHLTGAGSHWLVSVMRPGADPLEALALALDETLGKRDDRLSTLRSGSLGLVDASRYDRDANENLLLVVDQFEEIFRFQNTNRQTASEAAEFVELILAATRDYEPAYRVYVVMTLRSDYLGECVRFQGLPEALNDSQYLVPRMTCEQLREAIQGPAGLGYVDLEVDLLKELLIKASDGPDQLPVLQHLLMRMWEIREPAGERSRIGLGHYDATGGWQDALNLHLEAVWNSLGPRRDLAKRIFQRLTERAPAGREVRRPATISELADVLRVAADEVKGVVDHFRQEGCNFLSSPGRELTDASVIDISHESLIRLWARLKEWINEETKSASVYIQLADWATQEFEPYTGRALDQALQWKQAENPSAVWALRYRPDKATFKRAMDFLERSLNAARQEEERRVKDALGLESDAPAPGQPAGNRIAQHSTQEEIRTGDLPSLFRQASDRAARARMTFLRWNQVNLLVLILAAGISAFRSRLSGSTLLVACLLSTGAILTLRLRNSRMERRWYRSRAVAESAKTLAWRFMMCAAPYDYSLLPEEAARRLESTLRDIASYEGDVPPSDPHQATQRMHQVRRWSMSERQSLYLRVRLNDQLHWYSFSADRNTRQGHLATNLAASTQVIAAILALVAIWRTIPDLVGVFAVLSAGTLAWMQLRRYEDLSEAYQTAAKELRRLAAEASRCLTDSDLSQFVVDVESSVSREYTLWIAKRG
jgi:hypothetical protein